MPIVTVKSDLYRAEQQGGAVPDALMVRGVMRRATGKILNLSTDSSGSVYKLIRLPAHVILLPGTFFNNQSWGFAVTQVGVAGDADALFTKTTSATTTESPITATEAASGQRLWQQLGMAADPNAMVELIATAAANATGAGSMTFAIEWADNI